MRTFWTRARAVTLGVAGFSAVLVLAVGIGYLAPERPLVSMVVATLVLGLGVTAAQPAAIPVVAMGCLVIVSRVGAAGTNLTVSDAVLAVATGAALVFTIRPLSAPLRNLLWLNALYQLATLFTLIVNPFVQNYVEWMHAWMLVSGALLVGWTVGRAGLARLGISVLMVACLLVAAEVIAHGILQYRGGYFGPVYANWPMSMHKNFAGTVVCFAALVAYARPPWLRWSPRAAMTALAVFAAALVMTQSRQAIIGLGAGLLIVAFREGKLRRRWTLVTTGVVPAILLVGTLVKDQVEQGNQFNSVFQRIAWFEETLALWTQAPWLGHGLRFWVTGRTSVFYQPPNVVLELLTSAGVIGLAAFVLMIALMLRVLWRIDPLYGTLAFAVVVSRIVQSQMDLFWISVQVSIPFAVAGICVGALALRDEEVRLAATDAEELVRVVS